MLERSNEEVRFRSFRERCTRCEVDMRINKKRDL